MSRRPLTLLVSLLLSLNGVVAQTPQQADVLRVYTELVQTDVMVFDKQGNFVNDLKREDFELRIDGKPKQVEFFERVTAGSVNEEAQMAAARGGSRRSGSTAAVPLDRGRPIFFYVDDFHLDLQSVRSTQKLINNFVDREMGQNDEAAITSASGQIGFLQQLTDNKAVLRKAASRLNYLPYRVRDAEHPSMSEYQALLIDNRDLDVTNYFVSELIARNPGLTRQTAESLVQTRARVILLQASNVTKNSLLGLERLVRSAETLPGRKLVFFISDGFFLDRQNSDASTRLQRITSAAARSGVVIYSMDSRGLVASLSDLSEGEGFDPTGRMQRATTGELTASQDGLNALARDTGGKAMFNMNSLQPALSSAIKETSNYYLLAWKPERENPQPGKFRRIEVQIKGKPDLKVQVRRGFFDLVPEETAKTSKGSKSQSNTAKPTESELSKAIASPYPQREIPVSLRLNYVNTPNKGDMLSAALQVPTQFLSFAANVGKQSAVVTLAGSIFNEKGEIGGSFNKRVTVSSVSADASTGGGSVVYGYSLFLKPGIYHARVGARDEKSGKSGTAHAWIEIPDLSAGELGLSSVLIGARSEPPLASTASATEPSPTEMRLDYQFTTNDFLRFLVFIYNATPALTDAKPDVAIQVQVIRDDQPVVTAPLKKISLDGVEDLKRIPYGAEIALTGLPVGRYVLQVSVVDRISKKSSTQQTRFDIQ